ncbi:MAG: hypothetical protein VZQ98_11620 [Bacteroidales bacterium]|nr:hypothetical protein [Bacteroidales bacterium]
MKRFYTIIFMLFAFVVVSMAVCPHCMEWVDDDEWCSDCGACLSCCEEIGLHCENCGECLSTGNPCDVCGEDGNHCLECGWDYQCGICGKCSYAEGEESCESCGCCIDCQDMFAHCAVCGDCLADVDGCKICGVEVGESGDSHCQSCAEDYQCTWCEGCFLVDGCAVCEGCHACDDCIESNNAHCVECGDCLSNAGSCSRCDNADHCEACGEPYWCIWCEQCFFNEGVEPCGGCLACDDCIDGIGSHCVGCGACMADGSACDLCGWEMGSESHCNSCAEDYICDNCGFCYYDNGEIVELEYGKFCYDCAEAYEMLCVYCGEEERECDDCEMCRSCIEEKYVHCVECDQCLGVGGACESCGLCEDCALELFVHCASCGECFGTEGYVCEECGLCEACGVSEGAHCPECQECFESVEKCDNCGYCMDCALDMNIHCPLCEECKPDNRCESGGEHCSDCCEDNGWLCSQCGTCVEGAGVSVCDICELCEDCCLENTLAKNCFHNICIKSDEWASHYCSTCKKCMSECKHSAEYVEHTCHFVNGICTICKASEDGVPTIYRQPQMARCKVVDANQLTSIDNLAKYDTISFFTKALGEDLNYQWYVCDAEGHATAVGEDTDDELYIQGAQTQNLTITGPTSCSAKISYFCLVSNEKGTVSTDTVAVEVSHDLQWRDRSYLSASADTLAKTQDVWLLNGERYENVYSDYHYKVCAGNGCGKYTGQKALHQYGDWVVDYESIEGREGLRHKACVLCGEKFYQHTDIIADYGQPIITRQPKSVKCVTPDFENLDNYDGEEKYDTISFSVLAKGEDIEYTWHVIYWDDYNKKWYESDEYNEDQDDYLYVNGSTDSYFTITVPGYACFKPVRCFCVLSNENGTVSTDSVLINASHNFKWWPLSYWWYKSSDDEWWSSDVKDDYPSSGFKTIYSNYHYRMCVATDDHGHEFGADETPKKARHTYGDWTASTEHAGYVYKQCTECGELYWLKTATGGAPTIISCSGDKRVKVMDWHILHDQGKKASEVMGDNIVTFSVETLPVSGERCTYQWYCDKYKLSDTDAVGEYIDGAKSPQLTINVPYYCYDSYNAPKYYCVVTNSKGSTTSDTMKLTTTHNMHWCSINETTKNFSYVYKNLDMRDLYLKTVTINRPTATATEPVEKQYSKFHYMACVGDCGDQGFNFKGKKEEHFYSPWILAVAPTATEYGSRYKTCRVCGEEYWENIDPVADKDNPYTEIAGTMMKVVETLGVVSVDGGYQHSLKVAVLSGKVQRRDWINVMLPDSIWTSYVSFVGFVGEDEYEEVSSATKGDTVVLALDDPGKENHHVIEVGTILTDGVGFFSNTRRIAGHYTGTEQLSKNTTYSFVVKDPKKQDGKVLVPSNLKKETVGTQTAYKCSTAVLFNASVVTYKGQQIPVYKKNKDALATQIGMFVVDDVDVPAPDFYIVSAAGDTVWLAEKNQTLFDGQVEYSYANAKLTLSNANLKSIHLGDALIGGKSLTIFVKEGTNTIKNAKADAIDVAGTLVLSGNKGVTLNLKSTRGTAIKANMLKNTDQSMWNLNCEGYHYAIALNKGISQWNGAVEMHAKCHSTDGYAAFKAAPSSGAFGSAIYEDGCNYIFTTIYNEETEMDEDGYAFIFDDNTQAKELHLYVDPKISLADTSIAFTNSEYKDMVKALESFNEIDEKAKIINENAISISGKMSYDFKTHTLTMEDAYVYASASGALHIGKSFLDTLYIKIIGEGNDIASQSGFSGYKEASLLIDQNVKLIGDGTLYIEGDESNGIKLGENSVLTLSDQISLLDWSNGDAAGISDIDGGNAGSKFVIEKDAYLYSTNGLHGVTEFVIDNKGTKKTKHILYPYAASYTFDTLTHEIVYTAPVEKEEDDRLLIIGAGYDMQIADRWVSDFNAKDIMGDGSVVFDEKTRTLKLKNVSLEGTNAAMWINEKNIVVDVKDVCSFYGDNGSAHIVVGIDGSVIFTGDSMVFVSDGKKTTQGLLVIGSVTFTEVSSLFEDETGILANGSLCIRKSLMDFKANSTITGGSHDLRLEFAKFENEEYGFKYGRVLVLETDEDVEGNFRILPAGYAGYEETGVADVEEGDKGLDYDRPVYDILGRMIYVTKDYKGVVVQDGKKYILKGE